MDRFILALQFLTVFPIKREIEATPRALASSMSFYPIIGAVQGLVLAACGYALSALLPYGVIAALVLLALVLTNGGLHLDGFADTVDGLAGGSTPEERLRIMKDSSSGAVGVAFLVLLLIVKYSAIAALPESTRYASLFLFPVFGRWSMVPMACWSPYARPSGGLGTHFCSLDRSALYSATALALVVSVPLLGLRSVAIFAFLAIVVYLNCLFFRSRLGGVTGDVFGFQSEVAEVISLLLLLALSKTSGPLPF